MHYFSTVCSVLYVDTTASDFKFLFVLFLSEYSRKHDTVSGNPNQRTLLTRPVTRGSAGKARLTWKIFLPLKKCVGHSLKIWGPSEKAIRSPCVPT